MIQKIRLAEFERDLLRSANASLEAAQSMLSRAEEAWETALALVLDTNELQAENMKTMVLEKDFKYLVYELKEEQGANQTVHQD